VNLGGGGGARAPCLSCEPLLVTSFVKIMSQSHYRNNLNETEIRFPYFSV